MIAALLLMAGVGIVIVDEPAETEVASRSAEDTEGQAGELDGASDAPLAAAGDPAVPDSGSPVAGQPGSPASGGAEAGTAPVPPQVGSYRFRRTIKSESTSEGETTPYAHTAEELIRVEHVKDSNGQVLERRHEEPTVSEEDGRTTTSEEYDDRLWSSEGVHLRSTVYITTTERDSGEEKSVEREECDWKPDLLLLAFPMKVGSKWKFGGSCQFSGEFFEQSNRQTTSAEVIGQEEIQAAGRTYLAWVIRSQSVSDSSGRDQPEGQEGDVEFSSRTESESTAWFVPELGLNVKVVVDSKSHYEGRKLNHPPRIVDSKAQRTTELLETPGPL